MADRTVEDRLREEYFALLPEIRSVAEQLEIEIRHQLLPIARQLDTYEQIEVRSRIKGCESAVDSLRRRQEGAVFYLDRVDSYTLTNLRDLAGVRILAFPRRRLAEIDDALREKFPGWTADPVQSEAGEAFKYWGRLAVSTRVFSEYQIVSMLVGLFWEIEHAAIYKPAPRMKDLVRSPDMQLCSLNVVTALNAFEEEFERVVRKALADDWTKTSSILKSGKG